MVKHLLPATEASPSSEDAIRKAITPGAVSFACLTPDKGGRHGRNGPVI